MNTIQKTTSHVPLIKNERLMFGILFAVGFLFCTRGISQAPVHGWLHPISVLGILLGVVALGLGGMVLFRIRIRPIASDRAALLTLIGIILVKVILAVFY